MNAPSTRKNKKCTHCRKIKLFPENFKWNRSWCNDCMRQNHRDYYKKNREEILRKRKEEYNPEKGRKKWIQIKADKEKHENYKQQRREGTKRYRERHPLRVRKSRRKTAMKTRLKVLIHYGGNPPRCACCGEEYEEFLTIDHIRGGGTKHRKNVGLGYTFYRWLIKNGFPEGYQILCYNCNCSIGKRGYCPHKSKRKLNKAQ